MIPKYEAIAADIRRSIEDGALKPGDKLPTVVEFCELYSVSKITVKRAIEQITEEGLVTSRRGSGTYVKDTAGLPDKAFFQGKNDRAQGFSYEHRGEKVTSVVYDSRLSIHRQRLRLSWELPRMTLPITSSRAPGRREAHRYRVHLHAPRADSGP